MPFGLLQRSLGVVLLVGSLGSSPSISITEGFGIQPGVAARAYKDLVRQNLPKRRPVSFHSVLSGFSAMAAVVLLLPTFHPGFDADGWPVLFTYNEPSAVGTDLLWQSQLVAVLQLVSSVLGVTRLPKNSPGVRTVGFVLSALIVVQLSLVVLSSLNGTDVYLFDAFSMPGRIVISVANTALLKGSLDSIVLLISDRDRTGWETVPGYQTRIGAVIPALVFHGLLCGTGNAVLPVLCDEDSFREQAGPFFASFAGVQTLGYVSISLAVGLGALLATLQFEKKISSTVASVGNGVLLVGLTYDGTKFMEVWHTNEVLVVGTILAILVGGRERARRGRSKGGEPGKTNLPAAATVAVVVTNSNSNSNSNLNAALVEERER
eukprot:jgi/Psemu1/288936/fgenesh1_pg.302_\